MKCSKRVMGTALVVILVTIAVIGLGGPLMLNNVMRAAPTPYEVDKGPAILDVPGLGTVRVPAGWEVRPDGWRLPSGVWRAYSHTPTHLVALVAIGSHRNIVQIEVYDSSVEAAAALESRQAANGLEAIQLSEAGSVNPPWRIYSGRHPGGLESTSPAEVVAFRQSPLDRYGSLVVVSAVGADARVDDLLGILRDVVPASTR